MPFPGPRPVRTVCKQCHYSSIACMEGDVYFTPTCPRCKGVMEMQSPENPLVAMLIKQMPPVLRRHLNRWFW